MSATSESAVGECTGVTATYCPIHGDCTCSEAGDGLPTLHDGGCPLHDPEGPHGRWFDEAGDE